MPYINVTQIIETDISITLNAVAGKIQRVFNTGSSLISITLGSGGSVVSLPAGDAIDFWYTGTAWKYSLSLWNPVQNDWLSCAEAWTYVSADAPSFIVSIAGDKTSKYSPGMRIKLTQGGVVKYFIITAISYSAPNTALTLYGGTDYTLTDEAITNNYFSSHKAPQGFPLSPDKWTVSVNNTTGGAQASPVSLTWYNPGSISIVIPIGEWEVSYSAELTLTGASSANYYRAKTTLATVNNAETDVDLSSFGYQHIVASGTAVSVPVGRNKNLSIVAKTTYYLNAALSAAALSVTSISIGQAQFTIPTIIKARCAYL